MNIMVLMSLPNIYKAKTYILPMLKVIEIEKIHIIRDKPFLNHPKLSFHSPPRIFNRNPILKSIYKFGLSILVLLKNEIDLIYGIQMFPHGLMTWILSKAFSKRYVFAIIAGDGEIQSKSRVFSFFARKTIQEANSLLMEGLINSTKNNKEIPEFLRNLGILKQKMLPGYSACFAPNFFPNESKKLWDVVTIVRLHKIKRIDIFIDIIEKLGKFKNLRCAIIGDGPMEGYLKKLVKQKKLHNVIEFLGKIPHYKLNKYYNQANIFLLTSKNEGLPATIIEAMLTEMCVVSSDVGSISTCIKHGENGFLFNLNNIPESINIITRLLENKELLNKTAKNARETAMQYSAWNRIKTWEKIAKNSIKK